MKQAQGTKMKNNRSRFQSHRQSKSHQQTYGLGQPIIWGQSTRMLIEFNSMVTWHIQKNTWYNTLLANQTTPYHIHASRARVVKDRPTCRLHYSQQPVPVQNGQPNFMRWFSQPCNYHDNCVAELINLSTNITSQQGTYIPLSYGNQATMQFN